MRYFDSILFLSKYYRNFLYSFYIKNPSPYSSYESIFEKLMNARYFFSNYYSYEFKKLGYFSNQLVVDAESIQLKWAQDHNIVIDPQNWYFDIIFAQIKYYKSDILYIQDWAPELGSKFIREVKNRYPYVKIIIGYYGGVDPDASYFYDHDIVICCDLGACEKLKAKGINAHHIYHAFSPEILKEISSCHQEFVGDLAFIGRIALRQRAHVSRVKFLATLSDSIPFIIHGIIEKDLYIDTFFDKALLKIGYKTRLFEFLDKYISANNPNKIISTLHAFKERKLIDISINKLSPLLRKQYFGIEMFKLITKYRILLNIHSSKSFFAANLRLFETTGVGACLVTDWKKNINKLFEPDIEIVTYNNIDEAKEKIDFLRRNPDKIKSIAMAGQKRTLKDHTYSARAVELYNIIYEYKKD